MSVIAICSLKGGGSSTLSLALASVAASMNRNVEIVDATRNRDLMLWSAMAGRPHEIRVVDADTVGEMEKRIRDGLGRRALVLIDTGTRRERIRMAARFSDLTLIPVRFSPLSAYWAVETERLLAADAPLGRPRRHAFVATAITQIPSRIARMVEAGLEGSPAPRLATGLALRAAMEAPFLLGGTVFTLSPDAVPGLAKAQADVRALANAVSKFGRAPELSERPAATEPVLRSLRMGASLPVFPPMLEDRPHLGAVAALAERRQGDVHVAAP